MKLCILASSFPRNKNDNSSIFLYELASWLSRKGLNVIVIAPHDHGSRFMDTLSGIKIYRFPYFFPLKYQSLAYGNGILKNLQTNPYIIFQIPFFIISQIICSIMVIFKENINIIHAHWSIPQGGAGIFLKKITGLPCVTSIHGSDVFGLNNPGFRILNSIILKTSDYLIANSQATSAKAFEIAGKKPDAIIPMGVDLSVFRKKNCEDLKLKLGIKNKVIFSVGRLIELKGILFLIKALPFVLNKFPETTLIIAGDGIEKERLIKLSKKFMVEKHIIFLGQIKNHDLVDYYNISDVFVIPSIINEKGETEGLGVVLLEAMACKVPVIGSNVGGIPDIIKNKVTGLLVEPGKPEKIAKKIVTIFSNEELKNQLIINGYQLIKQNFSWDVISDKFINIYNHKL